MIEIHIAREFSPLPGPRYRRQGDGSGEEFLEKHLRPAFDKAVSKDEKVVIHLDGVEFGYPTSFLEEAFGGLARQRGIEQVQAALKFVSLEEPLLDKEIRHYIAHANEIPGKLFDATQA